ncbi:MAG TPA: DNA methyltransferase [Gallionellaceae bacterium]|jgi:site-specific DNA-methyltransferase (adenine-specific)|nr:DNA methyltransferase [Gallionellaceae bacterium]
MILFGSENVSLKHGNCLEVMKSLPDNSVDSIVTDPPYELGFMGKSWDSTGIACNISMWKEAMRVLKPGGHLLTFSGARTYHRMVCAIEDAGFEIRDQIMWVYSQGFPKSLDVSKAIDKQAGAERSGTGELVRGGCRAARGGSELVGSEPIEALKWKEITQPATEAAKQWDGWGTALKPAHEPIVVARKPLIGTVAENVLQFGTGAVNVDGSRVQWPEGIPPEIGTPAWGGAAKKLTVAPGQDGATVERTGPSQLGRFPANLILSYPEDEYELRGDVTVEQKRELYGWLSANA